MEKIALITGASRGIGRATARRLAHEGYTVAVNYHVRQDCADSLVAELAAEGLRAAAFQADVADRAQVEDMVRRVEDAFGPVSLLVNNAGVAGQIASQIDSKPAVLAYALQPAILLRNFTSSI